MLLNKTEERHIIRELRCEPENQETVKKLILQFVKPARLEKGCLYYDLYQKIDDPCTFYLIDGWINQDTMTHHAGDAHVVNVMKELSPLLTFGLSIILNTRISDLKK